MKEEITNKIMNNFISNNTLLTEIVDQNIPAFTVAISNTSKNFCVGLVDVVNSTKITAKLPQNKVAGYYEIFLNSMANILNKFGGVVIKNIGDSLLFYFPESCHPKRKYGFMSFIECALAMVQEHEQINERLQNEGLPPVDYRISADYGLVSLMKSTNASIDIIGTPVNMCAKINHQAPVNGIIIGGDLYQMVRNFEEYYFKGAEGFSIGLKNTYPIFTVRRKHSN